MSARARHLAVDLALLVGILSIPVTVAACRTEIVAVVTPPASTAAATVPGPPAGTVAPATTAIVTQLIPPTSIRAEP